jgi:virginiamycin B lyase
MIPRRRIKDNGYEALQHTAGNPPMRPLKVGGASRFVAFFYLMVSAIAPTESADMAPRSISELVPAATLALGKTADWVAVTPDAVWVGSTGPFAVHRIDPKTNRVIAKVALAGAPCAGLADNRLEATFDIGAAAAEAGITVDDRGVWLVTGKDGNLVRIDPTTGAVQATVRIAAGSYNPHYSAGTVWISQADGAQLTAVDTTSLKATATVATGPNPRFLTAGDGAVWTLDQGDGAVTRIDVQTLRTTTIALHTPGHGGDSLGLGFGAIWLTDYHAGSVARIPVESALRECAGEKTP